MQPFLFIKSLKQMKGWLKTGRTGIVHLDRIAILAKEKNRNFTSTKHAGIGQNLWKILFTFASLNLIKI